MRKARDEHLTFELPAQAWGEIRTGAETVERIVAAGAPAYGINTGFGKLANTHIPADQLEALQRNLVLSHSAGVGVPPPFRGFVLGREAGGDSELVREDVHAHHLEGSDPRGVEQPGQAGRRIGGRVLEARLALAELRPAELGEAAPREGRGERDRRLAARGSGLDEAGALVAEARERGPRSIVGAVQEGVGANSVDGEEHHHR